MTTNALTIYDKVSDPIEAVERFGTMIAKSRMFGCENEQQGQVLAMACLAERRNPIEIKRTYHIIDGNLSMRSDAMLAELRNRGGKHKVVQRTDEVASIQIEYQGETLTESLTWDEAKAEPWPFGKGGQVKKNWATPRARRQMLWARVVSEAVRTVAPEIVSGVYTPEESAEFLDDDKPEAAPVDVNKLMETTAAKAATETEGEPVDAEFQVVVAQPEPDEPVVDNQADGMSTVEQRRDLRDLFDAVGATADQVNKALAKRDARSFRDLTFDQASELIESLKAKADQVAKAVDGESRLPETTGADETAPVAQPTIDAIKSLMAGDYATAKRVKDHLTANGKAKLSDLSQIDAETLQKGLEAKSLEEFFARSLQKHPF